MPTDDPQAGGLTIRAVPADAGAEPRVREQLVALLRDAVEDGASVGFLAPSPTSRPPACAAGRTLLLLNTRRGDGPERLYRRLDR